MPDEHFGRALERKGIDDEAMKLRSILSYWIIAPHENPPNVSDLDMVKQLGARYECQESRKDVEVRIPYQTAKAG